MIEAVQLADLLADRIIVLWAWVGGDPRRGRWLRAELERLASSAPDHAEACGLILRLLGPVPTVVDSGGSRRQ